MRIPSLAGDVASVALAALLLVGSTGCRSVEGPRRDGAEAEIRRLYDVEQGNLLRLDIAAQDRFLPDDFVVTNPFGMFITKREVMDRLRANIIKYSRYDRTFDAFRRHGDTMIVVGSETVVPTADAQRPDAGRTVHRRFTEVWILRHGGWQKIVRHASNVNEP